MGLRSQLRPVLAAIIFVLLAWATDVLLFGGFTIRVGVLRLGSRTPVRAVVLAALLAVPYVRLGRPGQWREDAARLKQLATRWTLAVPAALCLATLIVAIWNGQFVAGGADSYGYVSQAELWEKGNLHVPQPLASVVPWPNAIDTLSPLGYIPGSRHDIVPVYSPGLPMLMVVFRRVLGSNGQYYVVPFFGALLVWLTFLLGRRMTGRVSVAVAAALVLAKSPPFLSSVMWPMTDVPVAAAWTLAFLLALSDSTAAALACGLVASLAVIIRPNLVPLALVFSVALLVKGIRVHGFTRRAVVPLLLFCVGVVPGVIFIAALNNNLYGSPLRSGYGGLHDIYSLNRLVPNARQYGQWILHTGCTYVLVGILAAAVFWPRTVRPSRLPTRLLALGLILVVVASYLLWMPFPAPEWTFLRFLLTLWPVTIVLAASLLLDVLTRVRLPAASAALLGVACAVAIYSASRTDLSAFGWDESRYVQAGRYLATHTEPDAVVLAMQHSGSVRYYGSRVTVRYDAIEAASLDGHVEALTKLGRHTYIVLDDWEERQFERRFAKDNVLGRLDWKPVAEFPRVRIWDTRSRPRLAEAPAPVGPR